jgi:adhesin/invasin
MKTKKAMATKRARVSWRFGYRLLTSLFLTEWVLASGCMNEDKGLGGDSGITVVAPPPPAKHGVVYAATSKLVASPATLSADGTASATITLTLFDAYYDPLAGISATMAASGTGNNFIPPSSPSNSAGVITATLSATAPGTKTIVVLEPSILAGMNVKVNFLPNVPEASQSSIIGVGPVVADGVTQAQVIIRLRNYSGNPSVGVVPTFDASGSGNGYGACSASDASGVSFCTMTSTVAETKTLSIQTPVVKSGGTVDFVAGAPAAATSTIIGTGPVVANGVATSLITITLLDAFGNPVSGQTPTFSATGSGNSYGPCSATNASGVSGCTMTSTVGGTKTLSIQTPVVKIGGTVVFTSLLPDAAHSTIVGTGPVVADGSASSVITITLHDVNDVPVQGLTPTFSATDTGGTNTYQACSSTNGSGVSTCTMKSTHAEIKTLSIQTPIVKVGGTVVFNAGAADPAHSSITGTGPVLADGSAASTVTITLADVNSNPLVGTTPTFNATNTGGGNTYQTCSATNGSGVSTCTMKSTHAETKTLSILTPIVKSGGTVVFQPGGASASTSTITGTGPVTADGSATATVTITILDAQSNPISGVTPTFNATDTGGTNT